MGLDLITKLLVVLKMLARLSPIFGGDKFDDSGELLRKGRYLGA